MTSTLDNAGKNAEQKRQGFCCLGKIGDLLKDFSTILLSAFRTTMNQMVRHIRLFS